MYPRRPVASITRVGLFLALVSCQSDEEPTSATRSPAPSIAAAAAGDPVVVAAGDIVCPTAAATPLRCRHAETAALIGQIAPTAVLLLGDIQYDHATPEAFNRFYDPTWGAYKAITWPSPGNHEYETPGAAGYFEYFNGVGAQSGRAGDRARGYYSFDIGAWHVVSLNSNCEAIGGCGHGSRQERWLRADLAANPATCTLAYWHHPRFSSGPYGSNSMMQAIWRTLYNYGADLVLTGHDHDYERFAPQTATGKLDRARGLRSFVVGTGGKSLRGFTTAVPNSELRSRAAFGVLKLTLHPRSYEWEFVPIAGQSLRDAGRERC
jgi:hypothetical protein